MPSTRTIRRRIKSVRNTSQITKAMQMVAASKMRKAQQQALAGRPYATLLNRVLVSLQQRTDPKLHPLLAVRPVVKTLVVVVTADRGLCGGLNSNLIREALRFDVEKTVFITIGTKGRQALLRGGRTVLADFHAKENPTSADARKIGHIVMEKFLSGEFDKVIVLYNHFINTLRQEPTPAALLPISTMDIATGHGAVKGQLDSQADTHVAASDLNDFGYTFEPSAEALLAQVLPQYVNFEIYQAMLDGKASEHSARMVAMKSATENAKELIKDLRLEYNRVRQGAITTELLEITTAQMALQ